MNENIKIQIIEMLRNIYVLSDKQSLEIYNNLIKNKSDKDIDKIAKDLLKIINKKNEIMKKLSINITKISNNINEKIERKNDLKNFNF